MFERTEIRYSIASETELDEIIAGKGTGISVSWPSPYGESDKARRGTIGVLWEEGIPNNVAKPLALIVPQDDQRRLFGRFSNLKTDISPLSAWCHFFAPDRFSTLRGTDQRAFLNGYEASWTGLAIAEALLLTRRSLGQLKLSACLATPS